MSILNDIFWREPWCLLLGLVPAFTLLVTSVVQRNKNNFADNHLMPWVVYRQSNPIAKALFSKNTAYVLAWLLIGIAAAGPRLPSDTSIYKPSIDIDIMLVVDVSRSMHATDTKPSRLRRAQIEIEELLRRATGARVGIIVFSARPHLFSPLTFDHEAIQHYLQSLDDLVLPTNGSDPIAALKMAHSELVNSNNPSAIILISDGDFPEIKKQGSISGLKPPVIPLYALGVGTAEGEAIQLESGKWLKSIGQPVITRLSKEKLIQLVKESGGDLNRYSLATDDDSDWINLYDNGLLKSNTALEITNEDEVIWNELYIWPLLPAIILLWIALIPLSFNRGLVSRNAINKTTSPTANTLFTISLFIIFIGVLLPPKASANNSGEMDIQSEIEISQAYKKFIEGDFLSAINIYKNINSYEARLGEGACYYKLNKFSDAIRQYSQAVLLSNEDNDRATALFNLGNAYFKIGDYEIAASIFQDSLRYNPLQESAQHNLNFSSALLKSVKARINNFRVASRVSSGPQMASALENTNANQTGGLAIDQSINREKAQLPLPELGNISPSELEALLQNGINRIKLAATESQSAAKAVLIRKKIAIINARLLMSNIEDQQDYLWRRLFEVEEGFPAPLTTPRDMPGTSPW